MGGVYRIQTFLDFYICFIFTRPLSARKCVPLSVHVLIHVCMI